MSRFATKCESCKMNYQGFHICVDLSTPEPQQKVVQTRNGTRWGPMSDEHKSNLSLSQQERWERIHAEQKDRDDEIIGLYTEGGWSYASLARKYNIGRGTILRILKAGEADGRITIRRASHTLKTGAV